MKKLKKEIEDKRLALNELVKSGYDKDLQKLISLSQELDELITKHIKDTIKEQKIR